jgi:hypothetical protein
VVIGFGIFPGPLVDTLKAAAIPMLRDSSLASNDSLVPALQFRQKMRPTESGPKLPDLVPDIGRAPKLESLGAMGGAAAKGGQAPRPGGDAQKGAAAKELQKPAPAATKPAAEKKDATPAKTPAGASTK